MTQSKKIKAIIADTKSSLPEKVALYMLNCTTSQMAALTTAKLAKIFKTPLTTLEIQFEKEIHKSLDEFLFFQKMMTVHSLMRQQRKKPWSAIEISQKMGYKEYPDFVNDFESQFMIHPQRYIEIMIETSQNRQEEMVVVHHKEAVMHL